MDYSDREWLFDLAQEYAAGVNDVVLLPKHIRTVSDEHLAQVVEAERSLMHSSRFMTTAMHLYCAAARAEQKRRAKA